MACPRPARAVGEAAVLHRLRHLTRLLAIILLIQVVLAPAHCLAMAAHPAGLETVLCAPSGTERVIFVGPDGQEVPQQAPDPGVCVVCAGMAEVALPAPPAVPTPAWVAATISWHAAGAEGLPPSARGPPYRPTGPPIAS